MVTRVAILLSASVAALAADPTEWHKRGVPAKDCAWVGEYPEGRCGFNRGNRGVRGEDGTFALDACPACAQSPPCPFGVDASTGDCVKGKLPFYLSVPPLTAEEPTTFGWFGTWKLSGANTCAEYNAIQEKVNAYVVSTDTNKGFPGTWTFTAACDEASKTVYNVELYASQAEFLEKMTDPTFLGLAAELSPLFGSNVAQTLVFGNPGHLAKQLLDRSSNPTYLTSADNSWMDMVGAADVRDSLATGAFALALPFTYLSINEKNFRAAASDMLAYANKGFGYPLYVVADDGAGTGLWLEIPSSEAAFLEHQPEADYVDLYRAVAGAGITGLQAHVLGDVSQDVKDLMATLDTAPVTDYPPVVPGSLYYKYNTPQPGPITPGLSAVYEYTFDSFAPKSIGSLTVYGALDGAKNKCEMQAQVTAEVSLSSTDVFSTTDLTPIDPSPLFPGATMYMCPSMQWDRAANTLAYLVVPQGVTPEYKMIEDYTGSVWRDRGYTFALVDDINCDE